MPPPASPSSVRWHYDNKGYPHKPLWEEEPLERISEIPSREEMKRRWDFRKTVQEESNQHRRVYTKPDFVGHNITNLLKTRSTQGHSRRTTKRLRHFAEYTSVTQYQSAFLSHLGGQDEVVNGQRAQSSQAVSTISVAFSPCGFTMASTHGDHTVKITDCNSGELLQTLVGHSRTPWTCKYHPIRSEIVASGCLGHQVRLWNWKKNSCLAMIRLDYAIISLSFHPSGKVLGVANGSKLNFWSLGSLDDWSDGAGSSSQANSDNRARQMMIEADQGHMLRCVHFPPAGNTVIVGGVNNPDTAGQNSRPMRGGISGGGMTFYLKLFDFNLSMAVDRQSASSRTRVSTLKNPRVFVPRALLYNDGGFDVSPDGKMICACAEYWLPDGVKNAMELLEYQNEQEDNDEVNIEGDGTSPKKPQNDTPTSAMAPPFSPTPNQGARSDSSPPPGGTTPRVQYPSASVGSNNNNHPLRTPTPQTPPANQGFLTLSPPSPPGRRFGRGYGMQPGRYVPHVVTISLDTAPSDSSTEQGQLQAILYPPHASNEDFRGTNSNATRNKKQKTPKLGTAKLRPRLGQLLQACPLDGAKASAVTCVKFSPSTNFCLIGYGVREPIMEGNPTLPLHPVTALYATTPKMTHVSTMLSPDDDVNIARFHPDSGMGFCYGTKQGRVRVLGPRPWNYYNC